MTREEIRMKLWCDVYAMAAGTQYMHSPALADTALEDFDQRFPAESSEPVDEPCNHKNAFKPNDTEQVKWGDYKLCPDCLYAVGPMVRRDDE